MRRLVQPFLVAGALALLAGPASAQMTMPKGAAHQGTAGTQAMMSECSAMMQEVMADPVVRKRMMAIMHKHMQHMQQQAGHGSMMTPGAAHHPTLPVASAAPASSPAPSASP
jgi:hypothetical protein